MQLKGPRRVTASPCGLSSACAQGAAATRHGVHAPHYGHVPRPGVHIQQFSSQGGKQNDSHHASHRPELSPVPPIPPVPQVYERSDHGVVSDGINVFTFGGLTNDDLGNPVVLDTLVRYDPYLQKHEELAKMPQPRWAPVPATPEGRVAGGCFDVSIC